MRDKTADNVVREQVESAARIIAKSLHERGELPLGQFQQEMKYDEHIFNWAIGWLVQEDEVELISAGDSFRIHRKEPNTHAAVFI
ncbi:MAG TPA: winged helix-turn-helix domain-containing protein [Candidatus Dormibacteraeota bacterium]|nr:winged helix-turn-helix domain-containing protein [Candidatus Dormibacteraeota bacterium]